jgi:hypothetical protein
MAYQVERARRMYAEAADDGRRRYTGQQIADELGVKRTTVYGKPGMTRRIFSAVEEPPCGEGEPGPYQP